ncbi:MAG: hypothetical protein CBB71_17805 [Rhodopirellula sp. TMED11]|nr:MAG: hypothetical protein CBB71_17805 [Rhodopirellula sp. TMED11]
MLHRVDALQMGSVGLQRRGSAQFGQAGCGFRGFAGAGAFSHRGLALVSRSPSVPRSGAHEESS